MEKCYKFVLEYNDKIKSKGIKTVLEEIESNYNSLDFKKLVSEIRELKSALSNNIKSVTFGINLDNLMRPTEVMLLSVDKEPIHKQTLFERLFKKDKKARRLLICSRLMRYATNTSQTFSTLKRM